jgi:glucose/arabinose dehydrogenase
MNRLILIVSFAAVICSGVSVHAARLPGGFEESLLVYGLNLPVAAEYAPDGRLFILEKNGTIRVFKDGILLRRPFLRVPVSSLGEQGLLGIAFDPDFSSNHYVYIYRTVPVTPPVNQVERYTANGDIAAVNSRFVLVTGISAQGLIHNGGCLRFGPDGKLYISTGESRQEPLAQSLESLNGKILRVNSDGTIPEDNPFVNRAGVRGQIYSYGLRNPWRFAIHPLSRLMAIGDVGADHFEEINIGVPGANYGWPLAEGPSSDPQFTNPAYVYDHTAGAAAVTIGFFYTGRNFPGKYRNRLFFSDFARSFIKYFKLDPSAAVAPVPETFATELVSPVHLTQAPDGSILYISIYSGEIRRIRFVGGTNRQPFAKSGLSKRAGPVPLTVAFNARGSFDPDGDPLTYHWNFGDGSFGSGSNPIHTYRNKGNFFAVLTVRDNRGSEAQARSMKISVGNNSPMATILSPAGGIQVRKGEIVKLRGKATDPEDGIITGEHLIWNVKLKHNEHLHPYLAGARGTTASFTVDYPDNEEGNFGYVIQLRAVDSGGLSHSDIAEIHISRSGNLPQRAQRTRN